MSDLSARRQLLALVLALNLAAKVGACIGNDPYCPCQDGDLCHYEGDDPMEIIKPMKMTDSERKFFVTGAGRE